MKWNTSMRTMKRKNGRLRSLGVMGAGFRRQDAGPAVVRIHTVEHHANYLTNKGLSAQEEES